MNLDLTAVQLKLPPLPSKSINSISERRKKLSWCFLCNCIYGFFNDRAQVVGWPPIRSYRKNSFNLKKNEAESTGIYVKVSMDGAPYLRKIDLNVYNGYQELLKALENMFKFTIGKKNTF